jgi:hypothetical protein
MAQMELLAKEWPHLRLTGLPRFLIERVSADFRRGFVFKAFRLGVSDFQDDEVYLVEGHPDPPLLAPNNVTMLTLVAGHEV